MPDLKTATPMPLVVIALTKAAHKAGLQRVSSCFVRLVGRVDLADIACRAEHGHGI